jgi:hypothetical protein
MRVVVRMWNADGYHKDVALLSEEQVHMSFVGMECGTRHVMAPSKWYKSCYRSQAVPGSNRV